ncbi:TIGR02186 family protein [Aestuariispira ectoiniformans]|uniref:TIGR02186 family protein n=1 Tax=Aestuariispira ectoiniformans TaxID=2775080 RepID=UPI00223BD597|nr:TIGR02186 family protein [Aestuariispira ectoiniformans]
MMRRLCRLLVIFVTITCLSSLSARAESLVADLSDHLVAITTGFVGTELLLFGTVDGKGDIVVVTHGPTEEVVVRKKERTFGLWMNRKSVTFQHVPSFYSYGVSQGALDNLTPRIRKRHQVGASNVRATVKDVVSPEDSAPFLTALVRNKQRQGLYSVTPDLIERRGRRLFRTKVYFPSNVPTGTYIVETLLLRDGEVISAQTTPLFINKLGVGAYLFRVAHIHSILYGVTAIIVAVLAGLLANWVFRKLT